MFYHYPIATSRYKSAEIPQQFLSHQVQPCVTDKMNVLIYKYIKFCFKQGALNALWKKQV